MVFTEPESGAEEAGTRTDLGRHHRGRCHRRKFMRKQMEMHDGDCHPHSHHHEKKMMKKMAKKWMKKMMWRRMMFRMCYGRPFGMGAGFGCPRRMRMMAATMMDATDTSSSDSGDQQEHGAGWRHRRCCHRRKFGRRFGDGKHVDDQATEKGKKDGVVVEEENTEETDKNAAPASTSKDGVTAQTATAENVSNQQKESAVGEKMHDKKGRRKEHKKWKHMRRVQFCNLSSDDSSSSSSSSSSGSSSDENEDGQEKTKTKKKHGGRHCSRGRKQKEQQTNTEGKDDERGDKCTRGRKAWKGKKFHKKMMKGFGRKAYFRRFC